MRNFWGGVIKQITMEQETITLKVIEKTHNKITLETASGNTFTFDPTKRLGIHGEDFYDFLFY